MSTTNGSSNEASTNFVSEFESLFESCFDLMTNSNQGQVHDADEVRTSVDQFVQKYLDSARRLEAYFLNKRLLLSNQRPEQLLVEDLTEVRNEITRKDQILNRLNEKFDNWISVIADQSTAGNGSSTQPMNSTTPSTASHSPSVGMSPGMVVPVRAPSGSPMQTSRPTHSSTSIIPNMPNNSMMSSNDPSMMQPMTPNQSGSFIGSAPNTPGSGGGNSLGGPLAYLERTTSNIGMSEARR